MMKMRIKLLFIINILLVILCADFAVAQSVAVEKIDPLSWSNIIRTLLALIIVCCLAVISLKLIVRYLKIGKTIPVRSLPSRLNLEESLTIDRRNQILLLSLDRKQFFIATLKDGVIGNLMPVELKDYPNKGNLALVESFSKDLGNG